MDLDFGHGFVPRVGSDSYKAVDRCLGPGDLWSEALDLPWAIIDGAWADKDPTVLDSLRGHGTKLLVDTAGWRYRLPETFSVEKMAAASWAPERPLDVADKIGLGHFVRASLWAQAKLGADAYLVPGIHPETPSEDLRAFYADILHIVEDFSDVPAKPLVLYVGAHSRGLEHAARLLSELPAFLSGIYLQISPLRVIKDSPTKLERVAHLYMQARTIGIPILAGHAGALTPALRALGVHAADAGLATAEAFDVSTARAVRRKSDDATNQSGGPSSRMYVREVGLSLDHKVLRQYLAVPAARDLLTTCRLPCHRFIGGDPLVRAKEHSLRSRIDEAAAVTKLPPSMRASAVADLLAARRSTITALNGALSAAGVPPIDTRPSDSQLNWFARLHAGRPAA
jgi:hypothetical protein